MYIPSGSSRCQAPAQRLDFPFGNDQEINDFKKYKARAHIIYIYIYIHKSATMVPTA